MKTYTRGAYRPLRWSSYNFLLLGEYKSLHNNKISDELTQRNHSKSNCARFGSDVQWRWVAAREPVCFPKLRIKYSNNGGVWCVYRRAKINVLYEGGWTREGELKPREGASKCIIFFFSPEKNHNISHSNAMSNFIHDTTNPGCITYDLAIIAIGIRGIIVCHSGFFANKNNCFVDCVRDKTTVYR